MNLTPKCLFQIFRKNFSMRWFFLGLKVPTRCINAIPQFTWIGSAFINIFTTISSGPALITLASMSVQLIDAVSIYAELSFAIVHFRTGLT